MGFGCADARLPYEDNSFDVVTNAVSVDYLTRPLEMFREMHRVLKPGGQAIMSFSNRCFPTKGALSLFTFLFTSLFILRGGDAELPVASLLDSCCNSWAQPWSTSLKASGMASYY